MATVLPTYGGPTKRSLIKAAYAECGQADYNYQILPEEYDAALSLLNAIMLRLKAQGVDLGYNAPTSNLGSPDDQSGIPDEATEAVALLLAERVAPSMGKTLSAETKRALAESRALLRGSYAVAPQAAMRSTTPLGAGNRRWGWPRRNYYPAIVPDDSDIGLK